MAAARRKPKYPYPSQNERPVLGIRVSAEAAERLRGAARRCGVSLSKFMEAKADEVAQAEAAHDEDGHECSAECRRIYTNAKSSPARATRRRAGGMYPPSEKRTPVM